jgi:ubiquinone/menaquinone biosynthesis C-methylase UbiE
VTPETIKTCCADLYASDWARLLLGESFHPGALALTERLGQLLGLGPDSRVLDVASGPGTSALFLARRFGCQVVGVDYSARNVELARPTDRVQFVQADAEHLVTFDDATFDAVVCECAFCTFPDKPAAAREIARVLRPGGRFGLADLTRSGPLPPELDGLLAWLACVRDALPIHGYVQHLQSAGLRVEQVEAHDEALSELVRQIRARLLGAEVLSKLQQIDLPGADFAQAKALARCAADAVERGVLGYSLILASKPIAVSSPPRVSQ